jgi:eukaryotic-like serine/threonine-protein kinase
MSLQTEQIVDGRYRVIDRIGSGGMADVYCAEDLQLGRKVALKVLHERFAADREFVERFRREASSAAGLQHPNVVGVYDRGEIDGTSYIAMEHVAGRTLKDIIVAEAPLHPEPAIDLVVQVLRAARFAHRRGVVHRDLKPHNVMVDGEGRAKVTDFGIARAGASDMTQTGSIMGTAQYLSPEQAQGHAVSARSDLYSVGVILYELLTGRVPFEGDSAVTIALKHVNEEAVPPSAYNGAVTPELDAVVLRALAKDPAHRPHDADEFIAALEHVAANLHLAPEPVPASQEWAVAAPADERERRAWVWWALLAAVAVAALLAALLLAGGGREVTVPNVVGAQVAVAEQRLAREGFRVETVERTSERPAGQVIGQDPPGGERAEEGSTIRLTVSDGPGTVTIPALDGRPRSEALAALEDLGLEVEEVREPSDEVGENRVIGSVPGQGSTVERGSTVTLTISSGPARATVPGVVGRSQGEATSTLEAAGFRVSVSEEETDGAPAGTVTAQSPSAGSRVAEGATVTITVAREPEQVEVPDVTGEEASDAVATLSGAGFRVRQTEREITTPDGDGTVVAQSPASGSAPRGSTVTITIARFRPDLDPDPQSPQPPGTETTPGASTGGTQG